MMLVFNQLQLIQSFTKCGYNSGIYFFSTRLTPLYDVIQTLNGGAFKCSIQLPINSPFKEVIVGPAMPSLELAKRAAALEACKKLHQIKELDDYMLPIGKDGPKKEWEPKTR